MINTKQKPIVDTQKIMRKESNHSTTENHQTREESKRTKGKKGTQNSQKKIYKIAISACI